jgi:hypothetical protein
MAEVKNTFIQSKMNRDLDGRILPNGQYREGVNIQISRSEGDDVGALENVLGTEILTNFGLDNCAYEIIGHVVDLSSDLVYVFITDYSDSSNSKLDNNITGQTAAFGLDSKNCFIGVYNDRTKNGTLIVGGDFLNFSKTHPITGVNLIEDLLFWTDNRNQPRKVNVKTVAPGSGNEFKLGIQAGYYTNEDTISVAKYYPFECISLLKRKGPLNPWVSTMTNKTEEWLPPYCIAAVQTGVTGFSIVLTGNYNIKLNSAISGVNIANNPSGSLATVTNSLIDTPLPNQTTITLDSSQTVTAGDLIYFQAPNPEYDAIWPGDETYLSDKFVRFSYRFEFDDGEYSLMAPFTQACFVPKQDGYFIGGDVENLTPPMNTSDESSGAVAPEIEWDVSSTLIGDEGKAYGSSIVEFFENKIQDIGLYIPAPYKNTTQSTFDNIQDEFKIKNIEIIYKESDSINAYILDTIAGSEFNLEISSFYSYDYQSRKPWKTLPGNEITRVYDKVPIRALAQESSGNRIIYGNYIDKHTSPDSLSYVVGINEKPPLPNPGDATFDNKDYYIRKEYQNHTVKQNRTYQVGIVLSDRYGRQSDVILSDVYNQAVQGYGSTIYHPYQSTQTTLIDSTDTWPGDMINMVFHQGIPNTINPSKKGYPGLYRNNDRSFVGFVPGIGTSSNWGTGAGCCYEVDIVSTTGSTARIIFCTNASGGIDINTVEIVSSSNDWEEGVDIASMTPVVYPGCSPAVLPTNHVQSGFKAETLVNQNTLGWYSWKIVVKQTEQDYYNCYLPGILAGYPKDLRDNDAEFSAVIFPKGDVNEVAHIVLINDNINKIPRDLSEIGPTQKIFGSSVKLFGRVENYKYNDSGWKTYNRQFDPETLPDTVVNIGNITDLNLGAKLQAGPDNHAIAPLSYPDATSILMPINFFNGVSNPLVAQLSTKAQIGWVANDGGGQNNSLGMIPYLAIYETAPIESDLDIYWETSTAGLISELNLNVATVDNTGPCDMTDPSIDWSEDMPPGTVISADFSAVSCTGVNLSDLVHNTTIDLISVINDSGDSFNDIDLFQYAGRNEYRLQLKTNPGQDFLAWNNEDDRTWNFTFKVSSPATTTPPLVQAVSFLTTITTKVQNATPNQTGMFDLTAGNNARTDLKTAVFDQQGQYLNLDRYISYTNPDYVIVGDWQNDPDRFNYPDNNFIQTFGRNFAEPMPCEWLRGPDGNLGYGKDIGMIDYRPTDMEIWGDTSQYTNVYPVVGALYLTGAALCRCSFPSVYSGIGKSCYQCTNNPGSKRDWKKFINRKITMVKNPAFGGTDPWDGIFESWNGAYGSIYPYPSTPNPNRSQEIVYSVARAYQVSAFFPFQTDISDYYDCNCPGLLDVCAGWQQSSTAKYNIAECVFSTDALGNPIPLLRGLPYMGSGKIQVTWDGWTATSDPAPPGPIYYDFADPTNNIVDPCVFGSGGEASVLQQYSIGNSHYWRDLSDEINSGTPEGLSLKKLWTPGPGSSAMTGAPNRNGFWYITDVQTTSQADPLEHHINLKLGIKQANNGGTGTYGQGPAANFWIENGGTSDGNGTTPATATLKTDPMKPIPPGRYVVTVRATDRSINAPAGKGSYFEWDVPVIINGPFPEQVGTWFWYKSTVNVVAHPNGYIGTPPTWQFSTNPLDYNGNPVKDWNPPFSFGPGPCVGTWTTDTAPFPY